MQNNLHLTCRLISGAQRNTSYIITVLGKRQDWQVLPIIFENPPQILKILPNFGTERANSRSKTNPSANNA